MNFNLTPYTAVHFSELRQDDMRQFLERILSSKESLVPIKIDKPFVLYGAGSMGKMAKSFFVHMHMPFKYVIDQNATERSNDTEWQDINIIKPQQVSESDKSDCLLVICVVTASLLDIKKDLLAQGWRNIAFFYDICEFYRDRYPLSNGWFLNAIDIEDAKKIREVFALFEDDKSRAFYLQFLAWRRLRIEAVFAMISVNPDDRFFIPEIQKVLGGQEVFVDCGAHIGKVVQKFADMVANKFKEIIAIEPDNNNFDELKNNLSSIKRCRLLSCAVADYIGKTQFYNGFDFASKLSREGNGAAEVVTLDSLNIPATFIKMHLEGGELKALIGAMRTINKYRPVLAVTVYHNGEGVYKLPLYLHNNLKDYAYLFRMHSFGGTGAVLYIIPIERLYNDDKNK